MVGYAYIALLGIMINFCAAHNSCRDYKKANPSLVNGEYEISNGAGGQYKAYCEFHGSFGYQFVSRSATSFNQNALGLVAPSTSQVLVRHLRSNGNQYDTIMEQMSSKCKFPISIQYNQNINYPAPVNSANWAPYLYLGFLPISEAGKKSTQGYMANGNDFTFNNCDANPNSYFAFFFNANNRQPNDYHTRCCYTKLMRDWINVAVRASNNIPWNYFFGFEMHFGGCGGYAINGFNTLVDVSGAALGLRFDL